MDTENKKTNNPPAFPNTTVNADGVICGKIQEGMTLRDYFANSAMQGICAVSMESNFGIINNATKPVFIAQTAYEIADAMLKQREL